MSFNSYVNNFEFLSLIRNLKSYLYCRDTHLLEIFVRLSKKVLQSLDLPQFQLSVLSN